MDIEHKLNLIQQIHREQEENERYIYDSLVHRNYSRGLNSADMHMYDYRDYDKKYLQNQEVQGKWLASFRIRFLIAILLFLCFYVMDKKEITYKEVGSNKIVEYISETMNVQEFDAMLMKK